MTVQFRGVLPFEKTNLGTSTKDVQQLSKVGAEHVIGRTNITNSNLSYMAGQSVSKSSEANSIHPSSNASSPAAVSAPSGCGSSLNCYA